MEDFTYYDFSQVKNSRMLPPRTARLHHKKNAHVLILSADCSAELINANKLHLRLCKNNLTDELFLVFSEDNGIVNTPKKTSKTTLYYNNKELTKFLASHFLGGGLDTNTQFDIKLSENLARSAEIITYKALCK